MRNNNLRTRRASPDDANVQRPQRVGKVKGLLSKGSRASKGSKSTRSNSPDIGQWNHASDDLDVSHSSRRMTAANDFLPNPKIPSSPGNEPHKKIWEGAYRNFLSLGKSSSSSSPGRESSTDTKLPAFSVVPGTKRIVTQTVPMRGRNHVRTASFSGFEGDHHKHRVVDHENRAAPSFLKSVFSRATSDGSVAGSRRARQHTNVSGSSPDNLDTAMHCGTSKHSPDYNHVRKNLSTPKMQSLPTTSIVGTSSQEDISGGLEALLEGSSQSPHYAVETAGISRAPSYGMIQPPLPGSLESLPSHYPYYLPKRDSTGSFNYQQAGLNLDDDSPSSSASSDANLGHHRWFERNNVETLEHPHQHEGAARSLLSQQFAVHLDSSDVRQNHAEPNHIGARLGHPHGFHPHANGQHNGTIVVDAHPDENDSNSLSNSMRESDTPPIIDTEKKKLFTAFHNQARFARDATSPFLGGESPSYTPQNAYIPRHVVMMARNNLPILTRGPYSASDLHSMAAYHSAPAPPTLETVDENDISIHKSIRLLKPLEGADSWESGRRYLMGPAALVASPLAVVNRLSGSMILKAKEATEAPTRQAFGVIELGECLMTYIGTSHHLSFGQWSSCKLVLRQNYLLEYECSVGINGTPRGFVHLQHARASIHPDFQNAMELDFYASPCAKADHRVLMIRTESREECTCWAECLNRAAQLRVEDLWDHASDIEFGRGRYAYVYPARRKSGDYYKNTDAKNQEEKVMDKARALAKYDCALKIIDKAEFWRRVVKGRERADTLVREISVQSTLTVKCGKIGTFLQLRGFFETSEHIVIELELLEGKDLFHHISSKGTLSEYEAATILRDMLTSLDAMHRVGLAHRDIKPANVLMCNKENNGVSVKVGDFGMSTFVSVDGLARGRCGTPGYVAPEILSSESKMGYSSKVDVFSAGVTLYVMLSGCEPFYGESEMDLIQSNKQGRITFPEAEWDHVSNDARDLVKKMTMADPRQRISAKEALQHPWITRLDETSDSTCYVSEFKTSSLALNPADVPVAGACILS